MVPGVALLGVETDIENDLGASFGGLVVTRGHVDELRPLREATTIVSIIHCRESFTHLADENAYLSVYIVGVSCNQMTPLKPLSLGEALVLHYEPEILIGAPIIDHAADGLIQRHLPTEVHASECVAGIRDVSVDHAQNDHA